MNKGGLRFLRANFENAPFEGARNDDLPTQGGAAGSLIQRHDHFTPARKMRRDVRALTAHNHRGGLNVIRKEAWLFCRTSSGVRLCWELEEPKGPKGNAIQQAMSLTASLTGRSPLLEEIKSRDFSGRGSARAEHAQGTPTQSHISPSTF